MTNLEPRHTKIVQTLDVGDGIIVMEDYFEFPEHKSNIYKLRYDLSAMWDAELPGPKDVYSNKMQLNENLICGSWQGYVCEISKLTGKIIRKYFTK
jgi:hypothetical protein